MTTPLGDIKQPAGGADLTLGAKELGEKLVAQLQSLKVIDKALVIANPVVAARGEQQSWLDISGTGRGILASDSVTPHLRLFDGPKGERECLMRLESADKLDDLVAGWLSSFDADPWEVLAALQGVNWCVIASGDFDQSWNTIPPPDEWPKDLPLSEIVAGVLCSARVLDYDADFQSEIETKIGTSAFLKSGAAVLRLAPAESKWTRSGLKMLHLCPAQADTTIPLRVFTAGLKGAEVLLPMDEGDGLTGPLVSLPGKLTLDALPEPNLEVRATFDLLSETVTARFTKPPNLKSLLGLNGATSLANQPEFFGSLLQKADVEAWIVLNWPSEEESNSEGETVRAIGGSVGFEKEPIVLVPDRLKLAGSLALEVEHPFRPEQRALSGEMKGALTLWHEGKEAARLVGSVEIPGWYFTAEAETQIGNLMGALGLGEIALPETLKDATVDLKLAGDVETKSFTAALEFEQAATWKDDAMGWALSKLTIGVDYDGENDELGFGVSAILAFRTFDFEVSGGYDGGWALRGAMKDEGTLDVSQAINGLLNGLTFPKGMPPGLVLKDVGFAAKFSANSVDFSVRGRTAKEWRVLEGDPGLTLNVEALEFERRDKSTRALFAVRLTLGSVDVLLAAWTPEGADAGWEFKGSTGQHQEIKIAQLIKDLTKLLGIAEPTLPTALESFSIKNLGVSYNTASKRFQFACEGAIALSEKQQLSCTVVIDVDQKGFQFGGTLNVGGAQFALDIKSDEHAKELKATWEDKESDPTNKLDLKTISTELPDVDFLGQLIPNKARLTLGASNDSKTLSLSCEYTDGPKLAFVLAQDSTSQAVALGLKPPRISTQNLGPLGSVLKPYSIALDEAVVVAATADAPKDVKLPLNGEDEFKKGLLLKGKLAFLEGPNESAKTLFSHDFECNLGGEKPRELAAAEGGAGAGAGAGGATRGDNTTQIAEGKNNVKVGRTIGPLTFRKVRFESRDESGKKRVYVLLDASLGRGGFDLDLGGFNINFPLEGFTDPAKLNPLTPGGINVGLDGLSISYSNPPLTVSGGFARMTGVQGYDEQVAYQGHLLIEAKAFQIAVLGSYGARLTHSPRCLSTERTMAWSAGRRRFSSPALPWVAVTTRGFTFRRSRR